MCIIPYPTTVISVTLLPFWRQREELIACANDYEFMKNLWRREWPQPLKYTFMGFLFRTAGGGGGGGVPALGGVSDQYCLHLCAPNTFEVTQQGGHGERYLKSMLWETLQTRPSALVHLKHQSPGRRERERERETFAHRSPTRKKDCPLCRLLSGRLIITQALK